jgi:hypothetical protein
VWLTLALLPIDIAVLVAIWLVAGPWFAVPLGLLMLAVMVKTALTNSGVQNGPRE